MPGIENPIAVMRADHAGHDRELAEIRRLTASLALPDGACGIWTGLYRGLAEFTADLTEHMRLENDVLFPQFEPTISGEGTSRTSWQPTTLPEGLRS